MPNGEKVEMLLAERGSCLSNKLWVREIRKLTQRGHQTALIATDYRSLQAPLTDVMFARWSQENFFKYAREHYNLDRLVDYRTEAIISCAWRTCSIPWPGSPANWRDCFSSMGRVVRLV
ncbi:MAG: hypothetical protein U9Q75_05600 [Pseudomonadota bacterium]|nr:hypothetical protein [Pseudomonadota bacterium]